MRGRIFSVAFPSKLLEDDAGHSIRETSIKVQTAYFQQGTDPNTTDTLLQRRYHHATQCHVFSQDTASIEIHTVNKHFTSLSKFIFPSKSLLCILLQDSIFFNC